jgi:phospholipid/cholesterol/gamma-HCH transport system ATP-binding protein
MSERRSIIEIRGLCKSFAGRTVLRGIDLEVGRGEILVIIGRSGCGKTVLLKHIIGLIRPDSGSIIVEGVDITRLSERELDRVRLKFGMLFQEAALFDSLTVFENVGFALMEHTELSRGEIEARVRECLKLVGLDGVEGLYPDQLSGGMKKRVGLARAIAMRPQIILYDEPTSGVDPLMGEEINALIRKLQSRLGVTSLVVTHDLSSALQLGDRIALLEGGVIVALGTPSELQKMEDPVVREFLSGVRQH